MKVRLEDIGPEGLEVTFTDAMAGPGDLGEAVEALLTPPRARLVLQRSGDLVSARGDYGARLSIICSRCLAPYEVELTGELDWAFRPHPADQPEEVRLDGDDLDVTFYRGGEIDLARALRDEMSLALPMAPLCDSGCPGLCPVCGRPQKADGACCRTESPDPRWAELAKLKQ